MQIIEIAAAIMLSASIAAAQVPAELQEGIDRIRQSPPQPRPISAELQQEIDGLEGILTRDANSVGAVRGLAQIYREVGQLLKAREHFLRVAELDPLNPVAFSDVGSVNWSIVYDKRLLQSREEQQLLIDEGVRYLDAALAMRPEFEDAMVYKSLLIREKAAMASDEVEKNRLRTQADQWFQRAVATRRSRTR